MNGTDWYNFSHKVKARYQNSDWWVATLQRRTQPSLLRLAVPATTVESDDDDDDNEAGHWNEATLRGERD